MLSETTQAILLLTAYFSKAAGMDVKPLTIKEWGRFAHWLKNQGLFPADLLRGDLKERLTGWSDSKITPERIQTLLNRGSALAVAAEKWSRAGLWVLTRSDSDYPKRLKHRLGNDAPPVFFGAGNRGLLNQGGVAVVGSRNTSADDLAYSRALGEQAAKEGLTIVSGGARGVDEAAMLGALEAEGTSIGVLANDLLRAATSAKYRRHLMSNNLVLLSPFHPEAGFGKGQLAMQRNKYIYCLADTSIAVHSGTSGGTWNGVLENIKHAWVPMWVKPSNDPEAGNAALVHKGAHWLKDANRVPELAGLMQAPASPPRQLAQPEMDLFAQPIEESNPEALNAEQPKDKEVDKQGHTPQPIADETVSEEPAQTEADEQPQAESSVTAKEPEAAVFTGSLYDHFVYLLADVAKSPKTVEELGELTQLHKTQLNAWLKQAVENKHAVKLTRPVRYQCKTAQRDIFKDI